jgi:hypothetical protein
MVIYNWHVIKIMVTAVNTGHEKVTAQQTSLGKINSTERLGYEISVLRVKVTEVKTGLVVVAAQQTAQGPVLYSEGRQEVL